MHIVSLLIAFKALKNCNFELGLLLKVLYLLVELVKHGLSLFVLELSFSQGTLALEGYSADEQVVARVFVADVWVDYDLPFLLHQVRRKCPDILTLLMFRLNRKALLLLLWSRQLRQGFFLSLIKDMRYCFE